MCLGSKIFLNDSNISRYHPLANQNDRCQEKEIEGREREGYFS